MPKGKKEEKKEENRGEIINTSDVSEEMRSSYLDYAMSVITSRAIPDVRDGLKPVHRRILYAMHTSGLHSGAKTRKSAAVTGEVVSKYHPHGTAAVYDAMVNLAQTFVTRYPLIIGQGNFGSVDGDPAAAERYTEAKLSVLAGEMLKDLDKETVEWRPNYDNTRKEPTVLPAKAPNLLLNGTFGIAVGMATKIPPHNLNEVCRAIKLLLSDPKVTNEDLLKEIKGPDFPSGGIAYNVKDIHHVYATGRGGVVVRGEAEIVEGKKCQSIIISSIPYRVNKSNLIEKIADLVKERAIEGIKDLREESAEDVRIVIDLKPSAQPQKILNVLYKRTQLEETFHYNMTVLSKGVPKVFSLKLFLEEFVEHRREIVTKRTEFDLKKAKAREHIVSGLVKAINHIDEIIKIVKKSKTPPDAKVALQKNFKFTEIQATAILEMRIQKLTGLEKDALEKELKELAALIKQLEGLLNSKKKIDKEIVKEIDEIMDIAGDGRKTKIVASPVKSLSIEDMVPDENSVLVLSRNGYIKRTNPTSFKKQNRGGVGVADLNTKEEDSISTLLTTSTHSKLLFFSDKGKVYSIKMYDIPEGKKTTKGKSLANFISLSSDEKITSILPIPPSQKVGMQYLILATKSGIVKKMDTSQFDSVRQSGLIAVSLKKDDALINAFLLNKDDSVMLFTKCGSAIHFKEKDVRKTGRTAAGVKGINISSGDEVVSVVHIPKDKEEYKIITLSSKGYGKISPINDYRIQGRGGKGIKGMKVTDKVGTLVGGVLIKKENIAQAELVIVSKKAQVIRLETKQIRESSRNSQGVIVMKLRSGDEIASMSLYK